MQIAVIGASGNLGHHVVAEALRRGHDVTAASRSGQDVEGAPGMKLDINDTASLLSLVNSSDVTVCCVPGEEDAYRALIDQHPAGRVITIGGAGTLRTDTDELVMDGPQFPAEYRSASVAALHVLEAYRASDADWTVLTPPMIIAPGERTGRYVTALDSLAGMRISQEDFAVAMLDEIEKPTHHRERFTVANED